MDEDRNKQCEQRRMYSTMAYDFIFYAILMAWIMLLWEGGKK